MSYTKEQRVEWLRVAVSLAGQVPPGSLLSEARYCLDLNTDIIPLDVRYETLLWLPEAEKLEAMHDLANAWEAE